MPVQHQQVAQAFVERGEITLHCLADLFFIPHDDLGVINIERECNVGLEELQVGWGMG